MIARGWCYWRAGYGLYVAGPVNMVTFATSTYYLCLSRVPILGRLGFVGFCVLVAAMGIPTCCLLGWWHYRRGAYSGEARELSEQHPYSYRAVPGKEQRVVLPWMLEVLRLCGSTDDALARRIEALIEGQEVGR